MTTSTRHLIGLGFTLAAMVLAAPAYAATGEPAGASQESSTAADWQLYFRCNATSWGADEASRLQPGRDPGVLSLAYKVAEPWMTTNADNCVFTETDARDGFGTWQIDLGRPHTGVLFAPAGDALDWGARSGYMQINYPEPGRYRMSVDWVRGTFRIEELPPVDAWEPAPGAGLSALGLSYTVDTGGNPDLWLGTAYAGYADGGVYLTTGGTGAVPTWRRLDAWTDAWGGTHSLPRSAVIAIAVHPLDDREAFVAFAGGGTRPRLFVTRDSGSTWTQVTGIPLSEVWGVSYNPIDPKKLYALGPEGAVAESVDRGATWSSEPLADPLVPPLGAGDRITTVTAIPGGRYGAWVGTRDGKIYASPESRGAAQRTWIDVSGPWMKGRAVTRLTVNPRELASLEVYATYAGSFGDAVWVTRDGGTSWQNLPAANLRVSQSTASSEAMLGVSVNPLYDVLYAIDSDGDAARSEDQGWSWTLQP